LDRAISLIGVEGSTSNPFPAKKLRVLWGSQWNFSQNWGIVRNPIPLPGERRGWVAGAEGEEETGVEDFPVEVEELYPSLRI
jgi:hypothetical protein